MTLDEYQNKARGFAVGGGLTLGYALLGLAEEAGEAAGKAAKYIRKHPGSTVYDIASDDEVRAALAAELGDCLWMVANAAASLGMSLDGLAEDNLSKLEGRRQRGTIIGEGDYR